jgi:hypothetical protein
MPETEQNQIGSLEKKVIRALGTVVEDVLIEDAVQAAEGNSQDERSFVFGIELLEGFVSVLHAVFFCLVARTFVPAFGMQRPSGKLRKGHSYETL